MVPLDPWQTLHHDYRPSKLESPLGPENLHPIPTKMAIQTHAYNYKIQYRPGQLNTFPYILSRTQGCCPILAISMPIFDNINAIAQACNQDPEAQTIISNLQQGTTSKKGFSLIHNRLHFKRKLFVPKTSDWCSKILTEFHSSLEVGYSVYLHTLVRLSRNFV